MNMTLEKRIQILEDKLRQDNFSQMDYETRASSKIPHLWIYNAMFPDKGLPGYVGVNLNIGVPVSMIDLLLDLGFKHIIANNSLDAKSGQILPRSGCFVSEHGFLVKYECSEKNTKTSDVRVFRFLENAKVVTPVSMVVKKKNYEEITFVEDVHILIPSPENLNQEEFNKFITTFTEWILKNDYREDTSDSALIHMLVKDEYETLFKDFDVSKFAPNLDNPDLFYGEGFDKFNKSLLEKLGQEKKGVVLFHGEPGTGKTHYIRYLLRELTKIDKRVIYIPPSMVEVMTDPTMLSFLTNNILDEARDTILLIEDAEPLLESRDNGAVRTTGISNLLNSTDGLLNDILGLVIIATFNTELSKIDSALLRPGRLMARKEFGKLDYDRCLTIAEELKIKDQFVEKAESGKAYTIAEICNFAKDKEVLLHDVKEKKRNSIGFGR